MLHEFERADLENHECDRFRVVGLECPFRRLLDDEEDEQEEEERQRIPLALPGRRRREAEDAEGNPLLIFPHADPQIRKALERMAALMRDGGLRSIPREVPSFPLSGRGHTEIIATLAAIAIMRALGGLRSTGSSVPVQPVRISEQRAARGLNQLQGISKSAPGAGRTMGRGGFHVNAAANMRRLFGLSPRRLLGLTSSAGFDSFSETGFF